MKYTLKYCVANVYVNCVGATVSYYAYQKNVYGLHLVENLHDKNVLWYDTEAEAKKHIYNSNECIISKLFELN